MEAGYEIINFNAVLKSQTVNIVVVSNYHNMNQVLNMPTTLEKEQFKKDPTVLGVWNVKVLPPHLIQAKIYQQILHDNRTQYNEGTFTEALKTEPETRGLLGKTK